MTGKHLGKVYELLLLNTSTMQPLEEWEPYISNILTSPTVDQAKQSTGRVKEKTKIIKYIPEARLRPGRFRAA